MAPTPDQSAAQHLAIQEANDDRLPSIHAVDHTMVAFAVVAAVGTVGAALVALWPRAGEPSVSIRNDGATVFWSLRLP